MWQSQCPIAFTFVSVLNRLCRIWDWASSILSNLRFLWTKFTEDTLRLKSFSVEENCAFSLLIRLQYGMTMVSQGGGRQILLSTMALRNFPRKTIHDDRTGHLRKICVFLMAYNYFLTDKMPDKMPNKILEIRALLAIKWRYGDFEVLKLSTGLNTRILPS